VENLNHFRRVIDISSNAIPFHVIDVNASRINRPHRDSLKKFFAISTSRRM